MKILAINGSPRGEKGNTEILNQAFLAGAREAGAETETVYLKEKRIEHCVGCFHCWTVTPGVCVHRDDMPELLERTKSADVLVYAMPLYIFSVPGLMKDFMDRRLPMLHPAILKLGEHYVHPLRSGWQRQTCVVISNEGFPETHHFDALRRTFELFAGGSGRGIAGMILCAGGPTLSVPGMQSVVAWYLEAARQAGRETVEMGRFAPETQAKLDKPLVADPALYARMVNTHWQSLGVEMPPDETGAQHATAAIDRPLSPSSPPLEANTRVDTTHDR